MAVKRKGAQQPTVLACTHPYDEQFELGSTFQTASISVPLNHPHCAKFCVLGGGTCNANGTKSDTTRDGRHEATAIQLSDT